MPFNCQYNCAFFCASCKSAADETETKLQVNMEELNLPRGSYGEYEDCPQEVISPAEANVKWRDAFRQMNVDQKNAFQRLVNAAHVESTERCYFLDVCCFLMNPIAFSTYDIPNMYLIVGPWRYWKDLPLQGCLLRSRRARTSGRLLI